jgi:hypothetical protein
MSSAVPPVVVVEETKKTSAAYSTVAITYIVISVLVSILFSVGAAKLSYDRFRSIGWAIVAFFFSGLYYPYYAFFVSGPSVMAPTGMLGAMRRALR